MPLEWKTTRVGKYEITHWAKHDPQKLLEAVQSKPHRETSGSFPPVAVHRFGPYEIAVRSFASPEALDEMRGSFSAGLFDSLRKSIEKNNAISKGLFDVLRQTVEKRKAIVEMPVAIIEGPKGTKLVTLWKKGSRPLGEFLLDPTIPLATKRDVAVKAMKQLALLHDAGFLHGHAKAGNFVVNPGGNPVLVDYTELRSAKSSRGRSEHLTERNAVASTLAKLYESRANYLNFEKKLEEEYDNERRKLARAPKA